jgi:transposase
MQHFARCLFAADRSGETPRQILGGTEGTLLVGDLRAGQNIAGLYSLVATCEARGINPFEYLADVLPRVSDHRHARLDELLPAAWAAARS